MASAELVAIMSAKSPVTSLSRQQLTYIFLGRYRQLDNGETAQPIDQPLESELRAAFYRKLVDKHLSEINAYWARLVFSGKTTPPYPASGTGQMLSLVAGTPGAVGYVESNALDARVRVVYRFPD